MLKPSNIFLLAAWGALCVFLLPTLSVARCETKDAELQKLRDVFKKETAEAAIVGSSLIVTSINNIICEQHLGSANLTGGQKISRETIYHWASNTKPFTGIAIMQLRDRGLLKLDDPVTKYLPELRKIHNSFGSMDDITIKHLLTHSGGFRNGTWPWRNNKPWEPFEPKEYSQLVAMYPFTEILFKPGSKYSYSNPAIIYLGRIIETLAGEDYEVYVDKNILRPLKMFDSYFDTTPRHLLDRRSHSYYIEDGKRTEGVFDADTGITVSNSGLNSPLSDMVKYLAFLTGDPQHQQAYDNILKRSSLEEMWQPQLPAKLDANGNPGFTTDIGLIYFLNRTGDRTYIGHGGDQNGFISYLQFEPATRTASLVISNTTIVNSGTTPPENDHVGRIRQTINNYFESIKIKQGNLKQ